MIRKMIISIISSHHFSTCGTKTHLGSMSVQNFEVVMSEIAEIASPCGPYKLEIRL